MTLSSGLHVSHNAHKALTACCGSVPSTLPILWRVHNRALHHNFLAAYHQKHLEKTFPTVPSLTHVPVCSGSDSRLSPLILHRVKEVAASSCMFCDALTTKHCTTIFLPHTRFKNWPPNIPQFALWLDGRLLETRFSPVRRSGIQSYGVFPKGNSY